MTSHLQKYNSKENYIMENWTTCYCKFFIYKCIEVFLSSAITQQRIFVHFDRDERCQMQNEFDYIESKLPLDYINIFKG
jgi:hypothetical protein